MSQNPVKTGISPRYYLESWKMICLRVLGSFLNFSHRPPGFYSMNKRSFPEKTPVAGERHLHVRSPKSWMQYTPRQVQAFV